MMIGDCVYLKNPDADGLLFIARLLSLYESTDKGSDPLCEVRAFPDFSFGVLCLLFYFYVSSSRMSHAFISGCNIAHLSFAFHLCCTPQQKVQWYYRAGDTHMTAAQIAKHPSRVVFASRNTDENLVSAIDAKCFVMEDPSTDMPVSCPVDRS